MARWGEIMRFYHGKPTHYRDSDLTNTYLGYWTDEGETHSNPAYHNAIKPPLKCAAWKCFLMHFCCLRAIPRPIWIQNTFGPGPKGRNPCIAWCRNTCLIHLSDLSSKYSCTMQLMGSFLSDQDLIWLCRFVIYNSSTDHAGNKWNGPYAGNNPIHNLSL